MAFALASRNTVSMARQMFLTTTSLISIVTVIFCGGLTAPLLTRLQVTKQNISNPWEYWMGVGCPDPDRGAGLGWV